ncbi:MAG: NAD+ synthase [Solirubrobacterales bacterium]
MPDPTLKLALAQLNPIVGDISGNAELAARAIERARAAGCDLVVLPELVITGYPPEDLLLRRHFVADAEDALERVAEAASGIVALVGCPTGGGRLRNSLAICARGRRVTDYHKVLLPNYGVFDERRYFEPGPGGALLELGGIKIGLTVCEDIWFPGPPASSEALAGASLIVNASASPYHRGKGFDRESLVADRAEECGCPVALCNAVGGQDELVFDGHSVIVGPDRTTIARARQFSSELLVCELELPGRQVELSEDAADRHAPVLTSLSTTGGDDPSDAGADAASAEDGRTGDLARHEAPSGGIAPVLGEIEEVYAALELGISDYVRKNGFEEVVLGLSGGIDSALVAMLCADALGGDAVRCVVMPSPYSADETQQDARSIARNLGCGLIELGIEPMMEAFTEALAGEFSGTEPGVAEENIQARIRGTLVMALSNKFGWLAVTTGNKSEMSVGYATLYGDMAGGFAPIKDVPKLSVYELVSDRNRRARRELVPASVIERPPTAELRGEQLDSDSLPPYEVLDRALELYVEEDADLPALVRDGIDERLAHRIIAMVDRAEYKRRQAPPGVKITPKAFGRDRRLPITNCYRS